MLNPENDNLDQLLRDETYIPDNGFTQNVLHRLPARSRLSRRNLVLAISFVLAGIVFLIQACPPVINFAFELSGVAASDQTPHLLSSLMNPFCLAAGLAIAIVLGLLAVRLLAYLEEHFG
jgi:hypothetical protein